MAKTFYDTANGIDYVFICDMSVDEVRLLIGSDDSTEELDNAFDNAQGEVVQQKTDAAFVVIRIK
jgi:hypothetical protein